MLESYDDLFTLNLYVLHRRPEELVDGRLGGICMKPQSRRHLVWPAGITRLELCTGPNSKSPAQQVVAYLPVGRQHRSGSSLPVIDRQGLVDSAPRRIDVGSGGRVQAGEVIGIR